MPHTSERERKALAMLGFAARARKTVVGVELLCHAMQAGGAQAPLVVLEACDGSPNTQKRIGDRTAFYGVPRHRLSLTAQELAKTVGKANGVVAAVGVTDTQLAKAILALLAVEE